ncbi:MAG: DUF7487 domain-containing protein [Nitrosopumilaceae archaeon]
MYSQVVKQVALSNPKANNKICNELRKITGLKLSRKPLLYVIINDIIQPKCKMCDKFVTHWNEQKLSFGLYCSCICSGGDPDKKAKVNITFQKRYDGHPSQSTEIKEKKKQTSLKNYGTDHPLQSKEIQEKIKQTNIKKYGVENAMQNKEIFAKVETTCEKRYGNRTYLASEEGKIKKHMVFNERFGGHPWSNKEIQAKRNITWGKKYGGHPLSNKKIRATIEASFFEKYGGYPAQRHLTQYCLEKRNDNTWLNDEYINKKKTTNQIGAELGIYGSTVCNYLRKYDISLRDYTSSFISILWIETIMEKENIFIQHAQNIGEYRISGTRYHADGYCKETNTIYEFYGDYYHGNPNIYESSFYNDLMYKTASELYNKTLQREHKIRKLGYNLVTMWETDFNFTKVSDPASWV